MTTLTSLADAKEVRIEAVVTRCGCGDPLSHASKGLPCPRPLRTENRGTVAYFHRNPLRRWLWNAGRAIRGALA
jgi:hypothetical protein